MTLKEQLQLSLKTPKSQMAKTRIKLNDAASLSLISKPYHRYIKKAAQNKNLSVSKWIEQAICKSLAHDKIFEV